MATNTTNMSELLFPGMKAIFGLAYNEYAPEYGQIFPVVQSKMAYEKTLGMAGFGLAVTKTEGSAVSYDDPFQGATHTVTHFVRGLGYIVTKEMYTDDQYNKINALPKALKYSMIQTKEIDHANVLNRAFSSSYTGADSLELCSLLHTLLGGGTEQNELSTAADLSLTSLEQAYIDIAEMTNDRGLAIRLNPKKLVVAVENDWTAKQLLGSGLDPETPSSNAINPAKGILPYIVNHYLTDPDAWFILTDAQNSLVSYSRWPLEFAKDNDFNSDNMLNKATERYSVSWDDWRGVYGSPGA
jgi:hypothetical protein